MNINKEYDLKILGIIVVIVIIIVFIMAMVDSHVTNAVYDIYEDDVLINTCEDVMCSYGECFGLNCNTYDRISLAGRAYIKREVE